MYFSDRVEGTASAVRGANIKAVYRHSPRLVLISNKLQFVTELELTSAAYATKDKKGRLNRDAFGVITDFEWVSNVQLLFAIVYAF